MPQEPKKTETQKEIESLKAHSKRVTEWITHFEQNQKEILKKIKTLEQKNKQLETQLITNKHKINNETEEAKDETKVNQERKPSPIAGIILTILGLLISAYLKVFIIGVPLIIWGVILLLKYTDSKRSKTNVDEREDYIESQEQIPQEEQKSIDAFKLKETTHNDEEITEIKEFEEEQTKIEKTQKINTYDKANKNTTFEEDVGIKWFAKIGILALIIGIGFFIKYAIDMNWIDHLTRIIMGAAFGISLIVFGDIISKREKYANWGKTLTGGGFAITYFIIYASYHFQEYQNAIGISQALNIILLSLVVIFAIIFSIKDNSQIIAGEAFFLGYITSLLSNNFGTMTIIYGLLLTIGLIIVTIYKKWHIIGLGGLIASYIMYLLWQSDNPNSFVYSSIILITYFIAFKVQTLLLMKDTKQADLNITMYLINSFLFFIL
ncbi:MAG: DUF2339 domain-containing protein, partial [Candidatus Woesearchaeota archaeon]